MVKTGPKNMRPTRRELRQMLRNTPSPSMAMVASQSVLEPPPPQHIPISQSTSANSIRSVETLKPVSRRLLPRSRKAGGRHKPIVIPSSTVISPRRKSVLISPTHKRKVSLDREDINGNETGDLLKALQARFQHAGADITEKSATLRRLKLATKLGSPVKRNSLSSRAKGIAPFAVNFRLPAATTMTPAPMLPTPADTPVADRAAPLSPMPTLNTSVTFDDPFVTHTTESGSAPSPYVVPLATDLAGASLLRVQRSNDIGSRIPRPASIITQAAAPRASSPMLSPPDTPVPTVYSTPKALVSVSMQTIPAGTPTLVQDPSYQKQQTFSPPALSLAHSAMEPLISESVSKPRPSVAALDVTVPPAPSSPETVAATPVAAIPDKFRAPAPVRPYFPQTPTTGTRPPRVSCLERNLPVPLKPLNAPRLQPSSFEGKKVTTTSRFQKENHEQARPLLKRSDSKASVLSAKVVSSTRTTATSTSRLSLRDGAPPKHASTLDQRPPSGDAIPKASSSVTPRVPPPPHRPFVSSAVTAVPATRTSVTSAGSIRRTRSSSKRTSSVVFTIPDPPQILDCILPPNIPSVASVPPPHQSGTSEVTVSSSDASMQRIPPGAYGHDDDDDGKTPTIGSGTMRGLVKMVSVALGSPWKSRSAWR